MKTLFVVRHAKSSWDDPSLSDAERPLLKKGEKRTIRVARHLKEHKVKVDLMISSPAVRAYDTARIMAETLGYPVDKIRKENTLYMGDSDKYYELLYALSDEVKSVMIFGHNPSFTHFTNDLVDSTIEWMPTSSVGAVCLQTEQWTEAGSAKRNLHFFVSPKMLK